MTYLKFRYSIKHNNFWLGRVVPLKPQWCPLLDSSCFWVGVYMCMSKWVYKNIKISTSYKKLFPFIERNSLQQIAWSPTMLEIWLNHFTANYSKLKYLWLWKLKKTRKIITNSDSIGNFVICTTFVASSDPATVYTIAVIVFKRNWSGKLVYILWIIN